MKKIQKIEQDVKSLNSKEPAEFRDWFFGFDAAAWDTQFEADAASGRLDSLAREALEQHERSQSKAL